VLTGVVGLKGGPGSADEGLAVLADAARRGRCWSEARSPSAEQGVRAVAACRCVSRPSGPGAGHQAPGTSTAALSGKFLIITELTLNWEVTERLARRTHLCPAGRGQRPAFAESKGW
jgi:hypothetical protein